VTLRDEAIRQAREATDGEARHRALSVKDIERIAVDAALSVTRQHVEQTRIVCPVHHMPDCSPLLNGCSLPNEIIGLMLRMLGEPSHDQEHTR